MKRLVPLYGRAPLGTGTPLVESLTGFIGRLAVARHLAAPVIFDRLIRPLVSKGVVRDSLRLSAYLASDSVVYDGLGKPAEEVAGALTHLTGLEGLSLHTLLPWRLLLPATRNGAMRWGRKRWCASCFAAWRAQGKEFWEPLLWRMKPVRRCPVHRVPFSETCPKCGAPQGLVQEIALLGTCRRCGPAVWEQVGQGLAAVLAGPEPGRLSATEVAASLGIALSTLKKRYPSEYVQLQAIRMAYKAHEREQRFAQRREAMRTAVLACLDSDLYPSKQRVFEDAGLSATFQRVPAYHEVWHDALSEHGVLVR